MIMCELELFYICVVGALLCRSHCQDFYTAEARVGGWAGNSVERWGSLEPGVLKT